MKPEGFPEKWSFCFFLNGMKTKDYERVRVFYSTGKTGRKNFLPQANSLTGKNA